VIIMPTLQSVSKNRWFNWLVGLMGLITIPLLLYNLIVADVVDKIFAFSELAMALLLFGTFVKLVAREPWR